MCYLHASVSSKDRIEPVLKSDMYPCNATQSEQPGQNSFSSTFMSVQLNMCHNFKLPRPQTLHSKNLSVLKKIFERMSEFRKLKRSEGKI